MQPRQLVGAHGRGALLGRHLDDAGPQDRVLLDHVGELVAHLQALHGVDPGYVLGRGGGPVLAQVADEVLELFQELRNVIEERWPAQPLGGTELPNGRFPAVQDGAASLPEEVSEPPGTRNRGDIVHGRR